jgi:hypothetical protein
MVTSSLALRAAARKEFWEIKDPATWTAEDKQALLFQSPWAQEGFARIDVGKKLKAAAHKPAAGGRGRLGDSVEVGKINDRSVPIGEKPPPLPNTDAGEEIRFRVLARWETAAPIRLAGGPPLPELAGQFYVIRLRGLPLMPPPKPKKGEPPINPNEGLLAAVKAGSTLERKNKPAIRCTNLFMGSGDTANEALLFFPRQADAAITIADKLVTLESSFTPYQLSIKFPLKEMLYKGELAL